MEKVPAGSRWCCSYYCIIKNQCCCRSEHKGGIISVFSRGFKVYSMEVFKGERKQAETDKTWTHQNQYHQMSAGNISANHWYVRKLGRYEIWSISTQKYTQRGHKLKAYNTLSCGSDRERRCFMRQILKMFQEYLFSRSRPKTKMVFHQYAVRHDRFKQQFAHIEQRK